MSKLLKNTAPERWVQVLAEERAKNASRCGAYAQPVCSCPYCGDECEADWVDVGVGSVQCGPYHCVGCGASQIGPEQYRGECRELSADEKSCGWYEPGEPASPYANTCGGVLVDHQTALGLYCMGFLDEKPLMRGEDDR